MWHEITRVSVKELVLTVWWEAGFLFKHYRLTIEMQKAHTGATYFIPTDSSGRANPSIVLPINDAGGKDTYSGSGSDIGTSAATALSASRMLTNKTAS